MKKKMHTDECTHSNQTPPSVNTLIPKEMAHLSWDISITDNPLWGFWCKGWPGIWSWAHEEEQWKCLTYPERWIWGVVRAVVLLWITGMTALHPHLLPWIILHWDLKGGNGTGNMIVRNKKEKKKKEILSTRLRFLYNVKFGNKTKSIWNSCPLFPL